MKKKRIETKAIEMKKREILLNKTVYLELSILELSKINKLLVLV